jgi:hypothetical protein
MNYTANYQVHGLSKVAGVGTELRFGSQIPLNKASTTCSKNDGCWLQPLCFSANNLPRIPFNNACLGMDLAKFPKLKAHASIPYANHGKETELTGFHKYEHCTRNSLHNFHQ